MRIAIAAALCLLSALSTGGRVLAADEDRSASFINPFPSGDAYKLTVIGDSLAEGLLGGLIEGIGRDVRVRIDRKRLGVGLLVRNDFEDVAKAVADQLARDKPDIAVVMLGIYDRQSMRLPNGRRAALGSEEWRDEYGRRIDALMKTLRRAGVATYWFGLPVVRRRDWSEDIEVANAVFRERALRNGIKFVDAFAAFSSEEGEFSPYGPDLTGTSRLLRDKDGVHFTEMGYRMLAHLVERDLKRELSLAVAERTIPLAGNEEDQSRIRPKPAAAPAAGPAPADAGSARHAATAPAPTPAPNPQAVAKAQAAAAGIVDRKAEHSRVSFKVGAAGGRQDTVTIEVLRPALPAAVLAALARQSQPDRPANMGDTLALPLNDDISLQASISPSGEGTGGRRNATLTTQTPYFKVWTKGERLTPQPGRIDDFSWPRPDELAQGAAGQAANPRAQ